MSSSFASPKDSRPEGETDRQAQTDRLRVDEVLIASVAHPARFTSSCSPPSVALYCLPHGILSLDWRFLLTALCSSPMVALLTPTQPCTQLLQVFPRPPHLPACPQCQALGQMSHLSPEAFQGAPSPLSPGSQWIHRGPEHVPAWPILHPYPPRPAQGHLGAC